MAYLCCGPETEISVTHSAAQKDPHIYIWGMVRWWQVKEEMSMCAAAAAAV